MRVITLLLALQILLSSHSATALTLNEREFPQQIAATATSPELILLGGSVRRVYGMVDTYIGLLYSSEKFASAQDLLASNSARRMEFHVTSNRISARRFTNAIEEGLALNVSNDEMKKLSSRMKQLTALFDHRFTEGTVGSIEWVPALKVSRVVIDGKVRGSVPGKDLNDALLKIWIGDNPVSERFKQQVLGLASAQ